MLMIGDVLVRGLEGLRDSIARLLLRTGIKPNTLTLIGLIVNIPAALLIAGQRPCLGGLFVLVAALFDMLDGAVAKQSGRMTKFGAFLDSTMDRISEMILFSGLVWYFDSSPGGSVTLTWLTLVVLGLSLLISYTRARAECEIPSCKVGLAERPERIAVLVGGLVLGSVAVAIWILAVLTLLTFLNRVVYTWHAANDQPFPRMLRLAFLDFRRGSLGYDITFVVVVVLLVLGMLG